VLSHGHYDHTNGLRFLAAVNPTFELLTGQGFFADKYGQPGDAAYEFLGNDFDARWLADNGIAHTTITGPVRELVPGILAITDFPRLHPDETDKPRFRVRVDGGFALDTFGDEVMLAIDTSRGVIALLGCSHPGVKNMLDAAVQRLGKPLYAVIGGTHLVEAPPESVALTIEYLRQQAVRVIGASHCTGAVAMERLRAAFGDRYYHNTTGTALFVD